MADGRQTNIQKKLQMLTAAVMELGEPLVRTNAVSAMLGKSSLI